MFGPNDNELDDVEVYAEGQGNFRHRPDPFDDEVRRGHAISSDCVECGVEHHQDDLFTCEVCRQQLCERHLDEDDHDCTPNDDEE